MKDPITIHNFESSGLAYDATQCDPAVKKGDVLVIASEGVVGVAHTWPFAITEKHGELHQLGDHSDDIRVELAESIRFAEVTAKNMGRKNLLTPAAGLIVGDLMGPWEITHIEVRENGTKVAFDTKDIRTGEAASPHVAYSNDAFMVRRLVTPSQPGSDEGSQQTSAKILTLVQAKAVHSAMSLLSKVSADDRIELSFSVPKDSGMCRVYVAEVAGGAIRVDRIGAGVPMRDDHEEYADQGAFQDAYGLDA